MSEQNNKLGVVASTGNAKLIFGIITFVIVGGIYWLRSDSASSNNGPSASRLAGAPKIASNPGLGNPTEDYVKLQTKQNIDNANAALATGDSAIPTIVRPVVSGSSMFAGDFSAAKQQDDKETGDCSVDALKRARAAGVTALELRCKGCSAKNLLAAGYSANDMMNSGFSAKVLKEIGVSAAELRKAGYQAKDIISVGYDETELADAGFSAAELAGAGVSAKELRQLGYSAKELHEAGYSAKQLANAGYTAKSMLAAGYNIKQLKTAGFAANTLANEGITKEELRKGGFISDKYSKDCDLETVKKGRANGASINQLKANGCSPKLLLAAGYTLREMKQAGYKAAQLLEAGATLAQLKDGGYSAAELRQAGANAADISKIGYTASQLLKSGYTPGDLYRAGVSIDQLKGAGVAASALRAAGVSASALKDSGFSVIDLKKAGYSAGDLVKSGYTATSLRAAGYSATDLKQSGLTIDKLKAAGFNAGELKGANYTDGDLVRAGFVLENKDTLDCDLAKMKLDFSQGVSASKYLNLGCDAKLLKLAGYSVTELRTAGYEVNEAKPASNSPTETTVSDKLKNLKAAGMTAEQLKKAGYTAAQLAKAGFSNSELYGAGYSAKELSDAGIDSIVDVDSILEAPKNNQLRQLQLQQEQMMSEQQKRLDIDQKAQAMRAYLTQVTSSWSDSAKQVKKVAPTIENEEQIQNPGTAPVGTDDMVANSAVIKAGDIGYAVLDTGINSDQVSPILATITMGPLKGAKLIGSFSKLGGQYAEAVSINFTTINIPGVKNSVPINVIAINQSTARTAIATSVDKHYLLRYGSILGSSFIAGYAEGVQSNGKSVETPPCPPGSTNCPGTVVTSDYSSKDLIRLGLGKVGTTIASAIQPLLSTPYTVKVNSGTALGLLYMADFTIPELGGVQNVK